MLGRIIVVGNGMVGQRLVERLTETLPEGSSIVVIGEEARPAYDRVQLSSYFSGKTAEELSLVAPDFYDSGAAQLHLNTRVTAIDRQGHTVTTSAGETFAYDKLVIATGSYPFVPPITGADKDGCFVYRTIEDLDAIKAAGHKSRVGTVVGGGLLGLEAAKALVDMGLETHVVEFAPRLMAVQVDDAGGALLRRRIEALGVTVHTSTNTKEIVDGEARRLRMCFADEASLETDMVVFSAGIRPRDDLARDAGLEMGARGGVCIDDHCLTSDPDIYAIGECALHKERIYGLVAPGYDMAKVAAAHLMGSTDVRFEGADMSAKLKLMGVDVASVGDAHGRSDGARTMSFIDERAGVYKKIVTDAEGHRLIGGVLVGDASEYMDWLTMVQSALPLPERPEHLLVGGSDDAAQAVAGVDALPDSAQVCSCNDVTKGGLCEAVAAGNQTLAALKSSTKASTSCGGCLPLVTKILNAELEKQGIAVNNHLCEHFPYTRQELFHLLRVEGITRFDALLDRYGRGRGCDICKPAVASMLATHWNDFILKPEHAGLQDSNDYFLANIQRNGTYSVVPRVPGGEITPDQLMTLGEVAKKYGLYTKITGGQRVDLFGAEVHQLPRIWEALIQAGFESGHAYGKAVRTVKSCVGSTWCRYGVQDSVTMAIDMENRYKGLRAPHKIKFGVSGCTRECAEAQSKDIGVIATEQGWNLYVCGNGGMKPRHAELFAADLDTETLFRYTDRLLMFYAQTAERLQRTATWRDGLEGGLDYLKDVIINDSLGIAEQLEERMAHVRETYACEWKRAIEDPVTRARFQTFVNAEGGDESILMVEERGQKRPANAQEQADIKGIPIALEEA
ncbi:nitrite reductase large subunit NirB [Algiphilus sp.]|uniref:nitrite reductase large subunit NirB n=1 Tax=Algiphilus sp. TaxID=1872431 RepID=UPI0032ED05CE